MDFRLPSPIYVFFQATNHTSVSQVRRSISSVQIFENNEDLTHLLLIVDVVFFPLFTVFSIGIHHDSDQSVICCCCKRPRCSAVKAPLPLDGGVALSTNADTLPLVLDATFAVDSPSFPLPMHCVCACIYRRTVSS